MLTLLLKGALATLILAIVGIGGGTVLGVGLAGLSFGRAWPLRFLYRLYVFVTRGTPVLVLALLVFYGLPAMNFALGPYVAGCIVLVIYGSAFFAEVFRGGVLAIPAAQMESGRSLGLPPGAFFRKIIAPIAFRYALPPYVNVVCTVAPATRCSARTIRTARTTHSKERTSTRTRWSRRSSAQTASRSASRTRWTSSPSGSRGSSGC